MHQRLLAGAAAIRVRRTDINEGEQGYEACDDSNASDTDGCLSSCVVARCGDSIQRMDLEEGQDGCESCDDGNDVDTDACRNTCLEAACGDGVLRQASLRVSLVTKT